MKRRRNHIIGLLIGLLCMGLLTAGLKSCDSKVTLPNFDSSIVTPGVNANAKKVDDLISAIKTPITLESADAISRARQAYDSLSDADKPFVTLLDKLKGFELDLAKLGGGLIANDAATLDGLLSGIKLPLDAEGIDLLGKIRAAFDGLSDSEKAKFKGLDLLEGLELSANGGAAELDNLLDGIKLPITAEHSGLLRKIRNAYEGLPEAEKAKFKGLDKLKGFEFDLSKLDLGEPIANNAAALDGLLNNIEAPITADHFDLLSKIRSAFESLSDAEKAKFKGLDKLKGFEWDLGKLDLGRPIAKDAASLDGILDGIKLPITAEHSGLLRKIREAYDSLSDAEKAKFKGLDKLKGYEADLNNALDGSTPDSVNELIRLIPTPITLDCEDAINRALSAYNALSDADKANVSNYPLLQDYLTQLQKLKSGSADLPKTGID